MRIMPAEDTDRSVRCERPTTEVGSHWPAAEWNETATDYPRDACIHELFDARAREAPESVALVLGSDVLTYGELARRSNRLARRLLDLGVGPNVFVGILLERSLESVVAALSVLKTGGAYVPLDPSHPPEQLAFPLEDTQAPVLLTRTALRPLLPPHTAAVACLDSDDWLAGSRDSADLLPRLGSAEGLACVMYTSGSTGRPKGVMVTHRGVVRLLFGIDYARLGPDSAVLHMAPPAFDASTFEVWGPLLHGGRCVIAPDTLPSARELGRVLREGRVDTLWLTAALYNVVIDEAPEALAGLKQLLIGGEALSVAHVQRGLDRLPATRLVNGYGPTEGTTFTCCYPIPRTLGQDADSVPIGRPISNTQVHLLDDAMRPVPVGVTGELYVGGDGVARGYLNRPGLTAKAFVPDLFAASPGSRLYRTGDLARWRPDGLLEFLGRTDDQVKVRGFRVELGAVETALRRCPSVAGAAVVARGNGPEGMELVAYVTAAPGSLQPQESDLRTHLAARLPKFMIPSAFVPLNALPLTPSGKVDRHALPMPDPTARRGGTAYVAPQDEVEARLATVWGEVLGMAPVGATDDFFRLGGTSLTALRLVTRVEHAFRVRLPPLALLRAPTVRELAAVVRAQGSGEVTVGSSLVAIRAAGTAPPFFFLAGGTSVLDGRGALYLHRLAELLDPGRPMYTFVGEGFDSGIATDHLVERLAARFVSDLRADFPDGPYHLGGHSFGAFLALEMARQLQELGKPVGLVALLDPLSPLYPKKLVRRERRWVPPARLANHSAVGRFAESAGKMWERLAPRTLTAAPPIPTDSLDPADSSDTAIPPTEEEIRLGFIKESVARYTSMPRPFPGRVTLFRPLEAPPGHAGFSCDDPFNGLVPLVGPGIAVVPVPGNHSTMVWEAGLRVTAAGLEEGMRRGTGIGKG